MDGIEREVKSKVFTSMDLASTKVLAKTTMYDGEIELVFNPNAKGSQPRYTANGEVTPGVTSILGVLNKDALKQWAADKAAYAFQVGILKAFGQGQTINDKFLTALYEDSRKAYTKYSDAAADLGSMVHYGTEVYDTDGTILQYNDQQAQAMLSRYIDWRRKTDWEMVSIERPVYSRTMHYAGTLDRLCRLPDGRLSVLDVKTSKVSSYNQKGVYDDYMMQVAAYALAYEEETGESIGTAGFVNPDKEWGEFHVHILDDSSFEAAKEAWKNCVALWKSYNMVKYHNKKQNKLTPRGWYASHHR
jgi:hypothetical protein